MAARRRAQQLVALFDEQELAVLGAALEAYRAVMKVPPPWSPVPGPDSLTVAASCDRLLRDIAIARAEHHRQPEPEQEAPEQEAPGPEHDCTSCGSSLTDCDRRLLSQAGACCPRCALTDTHADDFRAAGERMARLRVLTGRESG